MRSLHLSRATVIGAYIASGIAALLLLPPSAHAIWIDPAWSFRRAVDVDWPAERGTGQEQAVAEIYTAGHFQPTGDKIRVAAEDGRLAPSTILMTGPGDKLHVAFSLSGGARRYYIYFGNPGAPALRRGEEFTHTAGLLLEMRGLAGGQPNNARQMELAWAGSRPVLGRTLVSRLFLGINPFNDQTVAMARYSGTLNIPFDGAYTFAASVTRRGLMLLDGKPLLFIPAGVGDTRFNAKVDLKRGPHELVLYQANVAGEMRVSVVWKRPDSSKFELIPPEAFGLVYTAAAGPLEERGKPLLADYKIEYIGECFFSDHYSHRYRFVAQLPRGINPNFVRYQWDFGCGQTSADNSIDMVYLTDGLYPVKLTVTLGSQSDTQVNNVPVSRLFSHLDSPPIDVPSKHAEIVASYELASIPANWLPWDLLLQTRTRRLASMEKVALRLTSLDRQPDAALAFHALDETCNELIAQDKTAIALHIWDSVAASSALQPQAAVSYGQLMLYRAADFNKAVRILEPQARAFPKNQALQRLFGQALVLDPRADEGRKVLEQLAPEGPPEQQAALAGALARTIEFYITEKDPESAGQYWERWQQQYPADFLEGYSALLQTQMMELNKLPVPAANLAEAFALAVPKSPYAPRLLDRSSKLLAKLDPARSQALRATLKTRYPEDPLSQ